MTAEARTDRTPDVHEISEAVRRDGITVLRQVLPTQWAEQLDEDLAREFSRALRTPGGVAARGWNRFYFEPYLERVPGMLELIAHPLIAELSEHMFGPDWRVVELGCDIPLPGAENQPWHRDFPMPAATREEGRLTSIAVNASVIDVVDGPFQGVLGTHLDDGDGWEGRMFPPEEDGPGYDERLTPFFARRGNVSVRSGLMLHRGSAMGTGSRMRQVGILGIVSPDDRAVVDRLADPADPVPPRLRMSQEFHDRLHRGLLEHLSVEVVAPTGAELPPYRTEHSFEGLKMDQRKS